MKIKRFFLYVSKRGDRGDEELCEAIDQASKRFNMARSHLAHTFRILCTYIPHPFKATVPSVPLCEMFLVTGHGFIGSVRSKFHTPYCG